MPINVTDQQAATYGGGPGALSRYDVRTTAGGGIDWEGTAKGLAGTGAAAVCAAYGAAAASPICAAVGSALAGVMISGAKSLGAEGTTAAELERMAAEDELIFSADRMHAKLTPALWSVLQDLRAYARDKGKSISYDLLARLLAAKMAERIPASGTIWEVTTEHIEDKGTCPPRGSGPAPLPSQCTLPPIIRWATYQGRPLVGTDRKARTIAEPWPSNSWATRGRGRFVKVLEGPSAVPANALSAPMPPLVAPGLDAFGVGQKAAQSIVAMETWVRVLAEAAVKTAGVFDAGKRTVTIQPMQFKPDFKQAKAELAAPDKPTATGSAVVGTLGGAALGALAGFQLATRKKQKPLAAAGGALAGALVGGIVGAAIG